MELTLPNGEPLSSSTLEQVLEMVVTEGQSEDVLKEYSIDIRLPLEVCYGYNNHIPIIVYSSAECPICDVIDDLKSETSELNRTVARLEVIINDSEDTINELENSSVVSDNLVEELELRVDNLENDLQNTHEKIMSAYDRYPELGI